MKLYCGSTVHYFGFLDALSDTIEFWFNVFIIFIFICRTSSTWILFKPQLGLSPKWCCNYVWLLLNAFVPTLLVSFSLSVSNRLANGRTFVGRFPGWGFENPGFGRKVSGTWRKSGYKLCFSYILIQKSNDIWRVENFLAELPGPLPSPGFKRIFLFVRIGTFETKENNEIFKILADCFQFI